MTLSNEDKKTQQEADQPNQPEPQATSQQTAQEPNYKELYLRTSADLQNFQRRIERERAEWLMLMQADVLEKVVPLADELERALQAAEKSIPEASRAWAEGFRLILKNFKKTLTDLGVEEIEARGTFNPELHEALMQVESPEHTSGEIVQELGKGYKFKDKILKHARVSVAK